VYVLLDRNLQTLLVVLIFVLYTKQMLYTIVT
jgi:hypothetical protein